MEKNLESIIKWAKKNLGVVRFVPKKRYGECCCQNCGEELDGYTIGCDYASFCGIYCMDKYLKSC